MLSNLRDSKICRENKNLVDYKNLFKSDVVLKVLKMKVFLLFSFLNFSAFAFVEAFVYEESISEILVQCNKYQHTLHFKNRTVHDCEKEDPDDDYSYFITPMETRYSKQQFLCVLFFKDEFTTLDFKLLFSHKNYKIDAVSV